MLLAGSSAASHLTSRAGGGNLHSICKPLSASALYSRVVLGHRLDFEHQHRRRAAGAPT